MMGVVVTAAAALAAGYLLGRLRPWQRLGDWAADQVRHAGTWARGGAGRQTVVLAHAVTAPRTKRGSTKLRVVRRCPRARRVRRVSR